MAIQGRFDRQDGREGKATATLKPVVGEPFLFGAIRREQNARHCAQLKAFHEGETRAKKDERRG